MAREPVDFASFCKRNAQDRGSKIAFALSSGEQDVATLTFVELDQAARAIAHTLTERRLVNAPLLLLLESSLDFIRAFYGCLYAGAIAVPVNLPTRTQRLDKIKLIARDSGARVAIVSPRVARELAEEVGELSYIEFEELLADPYAAAAAYRDILLAPSAPAFLQYTSGSTGSPKGVIVSHANLIANQAMIRDGFGMSADERFVSWLPLYHDMGLAGMILQATYLGVPCTLMSPLAFVQKPSRWLKLISASRATGSGGPNFAYDLCVRRIAPTDLEGVDLSSWRVAFNGAEPVRAQTLEQFAEKFAPLGFSRDALCPCYGMAEATLFISSKPALEPHRTCFVSPEDLEQGDARPDHASASEGDRSERAAPPSARELVSCGCGRPGQQIVIVDPNTMVEFEPGRVGEIWVSGPHVAEGYWKNPEATKRAFRAYTRAGSGPFLRTGDLGFMRDGELFVTGRLKDLIIVSGKNHYPQDIESTVGSAHPALAGRPGAAVALAGATGDEIAVVQEIDKRGARAVEEATLLRHVRDAVMNEHGVALKSVLFIAAGKLPLTTSGKVQRRECRALLLRGELDSVFAGPVQPSADE